MFKNDYIDFFNQGQQKLEIYLYENCMPQDDEAYTLLMLVMIEQTITHLFQ
jgi:hypothetical protein